MQKVFKWVLMLFAGLLAVALCLFLVAKYYFHVNVPLFSGELDRAQFDHQIKVPDGFSIGVYAADVADARLLRFTRAGDLLVANPSLDQIVILARDQNKDGKADSKKVLLSGLNGPNGMDFYKDWLYVAETNAIGRVKFDHDRGEVSGEFERLVTGLPGGGNHWKKTLRFGPDNLMYVTFGSSCNVCLEEDERRAAMIRYQPDGSGEEIFARGMRNSAGFDWSPADGQIYATDNGRDLLGDDFPPCELNKIEQGHHYGWPFVDGFQQLDPDFGAGHEAMLKTSTPPVHGFNPHNAPLGFEFIRGNSFPESYRGAAIAALHGSWNRTKKDGYKVVSLHWDKSGEITEKDFVTGFLQDDKVIGRPAEVTQGPDGAFFISDDYVGAIYRVAYGEQQNYDLPLTSDKKTYSAQSTLAAYDVDQRQAMISQGSEIFASYQCMNCHDDSGAGLKKLENIGSRYDVPMLQKFLEKPQSPMPVYPFSDEQREALAVYLINSH